MNKTKTAKKIAKTLIITTTKGIKLTAKGIKLFAKELSENTGNKCRKCGKPSGKYQLCYNCYQRSKK